MNRVYVVQAKRSPIGSFLGSLSSVSPAQLKVQLIRELQAACVMFKHLATCTK